MNKHVLLAAVFDDNTWHVCGHNFAREKQQAGDAIVELEVGLWIFDFHRSYAAFIELTNQMNRIGVPYVATPLSEQSVLGAKESVLSALQQQGAQFVPVAYK